jgi:hypothetical protein
MFEFWYWVLSILFVLALGVYVYFSAAHIRELKAELAHSGKKS